MHAILAATLTLLALSMALFIAYAVQERINAYAEARDRVRINSGQLAEQVGRLLDGADLANRLAIAQIEGSSWQQAGADDHAHRELVRIVREVPYIDSLSLIDATGMPQVNSRSFPPPPVSIADREHFLAQVAGDAGPFLSRQLRNRVTGELMAVLSRRIDDPAGGFRGVATAVIEISYLTGLWARQGLDGGEVTLWRRADGAAVARWPELRSDAAETLQRPAEPLPTLEWVGDVAVRPSPADGVARVSQTSPVLGFPTKIEVEVGVAAERIDAAWRRQMLGEGSAALVALVAVIAMALWAAHLARRLESAKRSLEGRVRDRTVELERAVERQNVLLHEVNHRVKNNLQIVVGLLGMQAREAKSEETSRVLGEARARVMAIADLHRNLYVNAQFDRIDLGTYVRDLARDLWASAADTERPIRVEAAPIEAGPDLVVPIGLALVELVTNALKYAYADGEPGEVVVRLERCGDELRLSVADDGRGVPGTARKGLGTRLVTALVGQLGGRIDQTTKEGGGTRIVLTVPLSGPLVETSPQRVADRAA